MKAAMPEGMRDRKAGLVVFGVFEILFGVGCLFLLLLSVAGGVMAQRVTGESPEYSMLPAVVIYGVLATWFIWMGIGSIMARRWARALLLVTSWLWLISGIGGLAALFLLLPAITSQMVSSEHMPAGFVSVIRYVMLGFTAIFYVILPGILVLFYGSRHVRATCVVRDPQTRWTDRCPLPVLAISISAVLMAGGLLMAGFHSWATPFFGVWATGPTGMLLSLFLVILLGVIAWGCYRLRLFAWWAAVVLTAAWGISTMLSFSGIPWEEFFRALDMPPEQMEHIEPFFTAWLPWVLPLTLLWVALVLAYLVYTRRFFRP